MLFSQEMSQLKTIFQQAKKGEFVVASHQKNYTLWHIKDKRDSGLLLEEISVPIKRVKLGDGGWQAWVNQNAPQHIGWVMYSLDFEQGKITGLYSIDRDCWLSQDIPNRFLSTLLNVPFYAVSDQERRRVGRGPAHTNAFWNPPVFFEGNEVSGLPFDQYNTRWPQDGSELSNKKVEIFLLKSNQYPNFFPYWLQVSGNFGKVSVRIVDSGSHLSTPTKPMWN